MQQTDRITQTLHAKHQIYELFPDANHACNFIQEEEKRQK